jgi:hypothetical protein
MCAIASQQSLFELTQNPTVQEEIKLANWIE